MTPRLFDRESKTSEPLADRRSTSRIRNFPRCSVQAVGKVESHRETSSRLLGGWLIGRSVNDCRSQALNLRLKGLDLGVDLLQRTGWDVLVKVARNRDLA